MLPGMLVHSVSEPRGESLQDRLAQCTEISSYIKCNHYRTGWPSVQKYLVTSSVQNLGVNHYRTGWPSVQKYLVTSSVIITGQVGPVYRNI